MEEARSKGDVRASGNDRRKQPRDIARAMLPVAIDANDIFVASSLCELNPGAHRAADAEPL